MNTAKRPGWAAGLHWPVNYIRARRAIRAAQEQLRKPFPVSEDSLFAWRKALLDAEKRLSDCLQSGEAGRGRLLKCMAAIQERLGRREAAITCWKDLLQEGREEQDVCLIEMTRLEFSRGRRVRAVELLAEVSEAGRGSETFRKLDRLLREPRPRQTRTSRDRLSNSARKLLKRGSVDAYLKAAGMALNARYPGADLSPRLRPLLEALYAVLHPENEQAHHRVPETPDAEPATSPIIFCAGFGWSGSGAIFDFLSDLEEFDTIVGRSELRLIEEPEYGVVRLRKLIIERQQDPIPALIDLVWASVLGLPLKRSGSKNIHPVHSLLECWRESDELVDRLALETACFIRAFGRLCRRNATIPEFESCMGNFLGRVLRCRAQYGASLVNNVIHGHRIELLGLIPAAKMIVVRRDPADQLVSRAYESERRASEDLDTFIKYQKHVRSRFLSSVTAVRQRMLLVDFERFVVDPEMRATVAQFAGAEPSLHTSQKPDREPAFDAQRSARNIGVHRHYHETEAISRVRAELQGLEGAMDKFTTGRSG